MLLFMIAILGLMLLFLLVPLSLACFGFWVWSLVHVIRNDRLEGTTRLLWALLVWFLPVIGSVIYFFTGRVASPHRLAAA